MPLSPGTRIGPYEVLAPLGAGGMGEVWRAHDARLGRDVAIKALPAAFSQDPERLARFEREAKLLASLNHPGIAGIHGLEESVGQRFLILEFVEGESLEQRLRRGPLPVDDAVDTAIGIARALEAAHENGVVHRDLKPGNVMVTPTGDVKVLDFGLAKGHDGQDPSSGGLSMSPTLTHLGTDVGVILGTAAYMSPEQARGRRVARRTDIWSFGCVLYECLTGEQAYSGETVSDVVARILEREPAWDALPARTPPGVRDLLRRCLTKDPSRRLRDIGEARIALENLGAAPSPPAPPPPPTRRRGLTAALPWVVALLAAATAVALAVLPRSAPPRSPLWLGFTLPPGEKVDAGREFQVLAAAPDGKSLAYVSLVGGNQHLMFRSLENPKPVVLPGTEEARDPFFSPDGEWVAFFAGRTLRKVSVRGGTPVDLAEVALDRGGTWTERGDLIYSPSYESGLWRLPAGGGEPRPFTVVDSTRGERTHRWPCALPGGEWIVFTVGAMNSPGGYDDARIEAVSLRTGEQRPIARGSFARFAPGNRLIVARSGSLYEVPLDPADPRGGATPTPVLDGVAGEVTSGAVFFDVARDGTLFWVQGSAGRNASRLAWVDFSGNQTVLPGDPLEARKVAVSPDGARALVEIGPGNGNSSDIWLLDLSTISYTRLTFGGLESEPLWMPDGRRFAWLHDGGKTQDIMIRSVDGADSARVVYRSSDLISLTDVTPDGRDFVFSEYGKVQSEVWRVGAEGGSPPEVVAGGARSQGGGKVSPDGHWIAYHSDETGTIEVYVRPYRRPGPQSQMTTGGGRGPLWAPDGRSLFYSAHGSIYRIDVSLLGEMVRAGNPRRLFAMEVNPDASYGDLDLDPSGTRFLARITAGDVDERREIGVVPDWAGGLPRN